MGNTLACFRVPDADEAARSPSMATFDSDGPAGQPWTATERTRRTVALNPPEALQDLLQLVASILSKILDNPSDPKYRSLKQSGRVCQQRLLGRPGGRELLASLGAQRLVPTAFGDDQDPAHVLHAHAALGKTAKELRTMQGLDI